MITSSCSPFYTYTFALVVCLISEVEESHVNVMQQNCLGYFWIFWIVHDISQYFSIFSDSFNLNSNYPEISGSTSSFLAIPLPHAGPGFKLQQLDPAPHSDIWGIWTFWILIYDDLWWFIMDISYGKKPGRKGMAIAISKVFPKKNIPPIHLAIQAISHFSSPGPPQVLQKELVPRRLVQSLAPHPLGQTFYKSW